MNLPSIINESSLSNQWIFPHLRATIKCYIFEKQALWGYQIWYWEGTTWWLLGYYLATTWRPLGDHLATTWWPLGGHLVTIWWPFGDLLVTIRAWHSHRLVLVKCRIRTVYCCLVLLNDLNCQGAFPQCPTSTCLIADYPQNRLQNWQIDQALKVLLVNRIDEIFGQSGELGSISSTSQNRSFSIAIRSTWKVVFCTFQLLEYTIPPFLVTENQDGHNSEPKRATGDEGRSGRTGPNAQSRPEAPLIRTRGRDFWYLIISVRSSLHNRSRVTGSQLIGGSRL